MTRTMRSGAGVHRCSAAGGLYVCFNQAHPVFGRPLCKHLPDCMIALSILIAWLRCAFKLAGVTVTPIYSHLPTCSCQLRLFRAEKSNWCGGGCSLTEAGVFCTGHDIALCSVLRRACCYTHSEAAAAGASATERGEAGVGSRRDAWSVRMQDKCAPLESKDGTDQRRTGPGMCTATTSCMHAAAGNATMICLGSAGG